MERQTGSMIAGAGRRPGSGSSPISSPTPSVNRPKSIGMPPSAAASSPGCATSAPTTSGWSASSPRRPADSRRSSGTCRPSSAAWPGCPRPSRRTSRPPGVGFGNLRGRLPWPTEGRIIAAFGAQVHPRFGTRTFRNGVDIEANEGRDVAAVYSGHVIYTGWFKGYGNLIILDHDNEYYTLYAHMAEIGVRKATTSGRGSGSARSGTRARWRDRGCTSRSATRASRRTRSSGSGSGAERSARGNP